MNQLCPTPTILRVISRWKLPPRMEYRLVEDSEHRLWICESCPVGEIYWTVAEATKIAFGARSHKAVVDLVREAIRLAVKNEMPSLNRVSNNIHPATYRKSLRLVSRATERV